MGVNPIMSWAREYNSRASRGTFILAHRQELPQDKNPIGRIRNLLL